jgi:predicted small secreted protein
MKKILPVLLVLVLLCATLAACNDTTDTNQSGSDVSDTDYTASVPVKDMEKRVIRILCRDWNANGSGSILGFGGEVIQREDYSEDSASAVDIAKAEVRRVIEERYNCTLKGDIVAAGQPELNQIIVDQMAAGITGESAYDLLFDNIIYTASSWLDGVYRDLNSIETIDLSNPWWDQQAVNDLSVMGRVFVALGDINTQDNDGTWLIFFNKRLASEMCADYNFYEMVDNDEWNFDNFITICKGITFDSTGDTVLDENDTWALGTETYNIYVHALASGEKVVSKDEDDIPYFSFQTESMYDSLSKISDFYRDTNTVMIADDGRFSGKGFANVFEATVVKAFTDGRELFYMGGLMNLTAFRAMEDDFGMLPIPKGDPEQDRYYHSVSYHQTSSLAIPTTAKNPEDLGLIIEALGALSKEKVTPEYYDRTLKLQATRDDESGRMLDIIFASRVFDLGAIYNWGGVCAQIYNTDPNYASRFEAVADKAESEMEETLEILVEFN